MGAIYHDKPRTRMLTERCELPKAFALRVRELGNRWQSLRVLAPVVLLLAVPACTKLGPDFESPQAPATEAWLEQGNPKIKAEEAESSSWWRVFEDPKLNELIQKAYRQNLNLRTAGLRVLEARARLGIAVGNQYPQQQEGTGGYSLNRTSENAPNNANTNRSFGDLTVGLDTAWEIDFWGRFQRAIESADADLGATIADYDDLLVSLTADVASFYVLMRQAEERLRIARTNAEIQKESLRIAQVRFDNGAVTELDVQQAKALLADTLSFIPQFETDRRQAQNALSVLLGTTPREIQSIVEAPGEIPNAPTEVAIGIPNELLRRRPDIRRAELVAAAQSAQIGIAESDLYPRFSLAGFVGFETSHSGGRQSNDAGLGDIFKGGSFTGSVGPSFRWPILNYGRLKNNVRVQDARFQQLVTDYQDSVLRAYQEVEDGLVGFLNAQDQAKFLGESVAAYQRSVDLSLLQYREGTVDYIRVLDTQRFLVDAQDRLAISQGSIALNLVTTYRALGGGWETRNVNQLVPDETLEVMKARTDWGDLLPPGDLNQAPVTGEESGQRDNRFRRPDW